MERFCYGFKSSFKIKRFKVRYEIFLCVFNLLTSSQLHPIYEHKTYPAVFAAANGCLKQ